MDEQTQFPTGALLDPKDPRDILFATVSPITVDLPRKFSTRVKQSPVAMQKYGSCVGFSNKSFCEYHHAMDAGIMEMASGRAQYAMIKQVDGMPDIEGSWPRAGLKVAFGKGFILDSQYSEEPSPTHAEYKKLPPDDLVEGAIERTLKGGFARVNNLQELKQAIYEHGSVLVSVSVYNTFDAPAANGFIGKKTNPNYHRGMHAIIATGWDDDRDGGVIEIKNNWGTGWADGGYGYISYDYEGGGNPPLWDMWVRVPSIDPTATLGAPIAIGYPVETPKPYITQGFGARPEYYAKYGMKGHNGLDFRTYDVSGKWIIACDDGEVILAGNDGSYGLTVRIKHKWGLSLYAHNSSLLVADTQSNGETVKVRRGQRIAIAGSTGDSSAEHCHFGIRINGVKNSGFYDWVDPTPYFGEKTMTKYYRINQAGKSGIMILEGFSGTVLFENDWTEYQTLLAISGLSMNTPEISVPAGKYFRINDKGKLGIMILEGFSGTILFENNWTEYQKLLQITNGTETAPIINTI